jgi:hypothetical protein
MNLTVNSIRPQVTPHFGARIEFSKDEEGQKAKEYFENGLNILSMEDRSKAEALRDAIFNADPGVILMVKNPRTVCVLPAKKNANTPEDYGCYQDLIVRDIYKQAHYDVIKEFLPTLLRIAQNARKQPESGDITDSLSPLSYSDRFMYHPTFDRNC